MVDAATGEAIEPYLSNQTDCGQEAIDAEAQDQPVGFQVSDPVSYEIMAP